jgi:broad specificity phosphatase PhoE
MAQPLRIFFIRHGETAWTITGQHTGVTDLPLTERGEAEARALRPWLQKIAFARVFVSPRQRARLTCELIGLSGMAEVDADLAEWNYGDYEGLTSRSIDAERPGWDIFSDGCPGGEAPQQVSDRADRVIGRLRALEGNIALFSHGEIGRALAARWIGAPIALARNFALGTASVSVLAYQAHHLANPVIEIWNASPANWSGATPAPNGPRGSP